MPPDPSDPAITTTVVVPAYNEAARLGRGFARLEPVLDELDVEHTEFVIVDDGSADDTARQALVVYGELPHRLVVRQPSNRGKGAAVRLGVSVARGERILAVDADMAIDPHHYRPMLDELERADLVAGSRARNGRIRYQSLPRTVAGRVFNRLVRHYTGVELADTQCGAKAFRRGPARVLGLLGLVDGFAYDAEFFLLARQLGFSVLAHPVTWEDVGGSSVHLRSAPPAMIADLRALPRTKHVNPVVVADRDVSREAVGDAARAARVQGLVIARGPEDALIVFARDGAIGATAVAASIGATLRTTDVAELAGRAFEAV